jgi:uncharacterized protein with HEPN domain
MRSDIDRIGDIRASIERCLEYRLYLDEERGPTGRMAYDAVLRRLAVS